MYRGVLVGGPGTGETTVLDHLSLEGYAVGVDAARSIIRERKATGLDPRPDPRMFGEQILEREISSYRSVTRSLVFFERGVVDAVGLLYGAGALDDAEAARLINQYRYSQVFLFPPWEETYSTDEERDHTYEHSVRVFEASHNWYHRYGYDLVEVPLAPANVRAEFVLTHAGFSSRG